MKSEPLIKLKHVTIRLRDTWIFPDTDWEIATGENWAVLGPNGSGKTSLVRLLLGELPAVQGELLRAYDPDQFVMGYVSFELQDWFLKGADAADKSGKALDILLSGLCPDLASPAVCATLDHLKIRPLLERRIRALSTGEMRRLLIARALLKKPDLFILDEPFSGLDRASRRLTAEMIEIAAAGKTQLMLVTNRPEEILPCMTHVASVKNCRLIHQGARGSLDRQTLAALYDIEGAAADPRSVAGKARPTASPKVLVRMKKVTVAYGSRKVLDGIDWTIRKGEHWAVVGPNGAGKSTLLNLINGDNTQGYANELYLFGMRKGTGETVWEIKQRLGIVSERLQFAYRPDTPALDAVASGFFDSNGLYRIPTPAQRAEARRWMDLLGIARFADKLFERLSFGERRMITIARAAVKDPELLLLDEPCSGLDLSNRKRIAHMMDAIASRGRTTLVYVTHHPEDLPACITHMLALDGTGKVHRSKFREA